MKTQNKNPLPDQKPLPLTRPLKVLVVDDEEGFRNLLKWELTNQGIQAATATNGVEAIQMVMQIKFDVIITDITMPEMDGLKLLAEINRISPETRVIIATGFGVVETAVHAMKNRAFDFVLKPYDLDHLVARVKEAIQHPPCCKHCGSFSHD